ncbi:Serine/threonine kinase [Coemansia sp. RSA 1797]|nr:Serine/threonine kinase [Coemansia sp. RSA 1797]
MGNVPTKDSSTGTGSRGVHSFTQHQVISEDAHSKVQIVEHPLTHELFALRRMSKQHIVASRQTQRILHERDLLESLDHPFVLGLQFSFQDTYGVYMGVSLMKGGRLDEQMQGRWASEAVVRVWVAELACAVRYLHEEHMVVHGRVDMQNVWVGEDGHVALGGFGEQDGHVDEQDGHVDEHVSDRVQEPADTRDQSLIARDRDRNALLAPEAQKDARPDYAGDWWGLGIIMYTCLFGHPPFRSPSHLETQRMILSSDIVFPVSTDLRVTTNCMSAIRGLLQKNPIDRLGYRASGVSRLRQHPFFATLDWSLVEARDVTVPFAVRTLCEPRESMFAEVGECMELHVPELEPRPELVELERKFVEFDYGEFVRFRAYVERRRGISAQAAECARAECTRVGTLGVQMDASVAVGDVPLECLTLAGQPIVKPIVKKSVKRGGLGIKSEGMRRSNSIVRAQGLRKVSIADDTDSLRRDSSVSTRDPSSRLMRRTTSTAIARLKGKKRAPRTLEPTCPNVLSQPPSFVPIDPQTWTQMATEQQNLARRYCTKMAHENQRLLSTISHDEDEDELFQSTYSLTAASLLPAARRAGCRMREKAGGVDPGLAMRRDACKSSPDLNAWSTHGALHGRLTRHDAPSTPVLSGELTRHEGLSMLSVSEQPSMLSVSEQPSVLSVSEQPSVLSVSEQPSVLSVSEQPSTLSVSEQPSVLSVSEQPSMPSLKEQPTIPSLNEQPTIPTLKEQPTIPSLNEQPSIPSLNERVARNKNSTTSPLNTSNTATPSLTEQRTRRKAPNSLPFTQLTRHKGPSSTSLHRPRRMHAGSRASVTVPRLQPIAAAWPVLRTEPRIATRMARSPSTPISPMSDTEWDMLPEACDRFGLSSAAADVAKKAGCLPSRKRSF